jgi:hypothetical protein
MALDGRLRAGFGELFELELRPRLSELNSIVVVEKLFGDSHSVYIAAVGRAEVLEKEVSAEANYLSVIAGHSGIRKTERVLRPSPDGETRFFEYEDASPVSR